MLVKDIMTYHPIMVSADKLAAEAQRILVENHIRHLPVVGDGKRLLGLLTRSRFALDADTLDSLNVWDIGRHTAKLKTKNLMLKRKSVYTIQEHRSVERAADVMTEQKIGCLPVVDKDDVVVGIITEIDLLNAFKEMLGLPASGVRLTVRTSNKPGTFRRLTDIFSENDWGVMGIGTYPSPRHDGCYETVVKIPNANAARVSEIIAAIDGVELVDIREIN